MAAGRRRSARTARYPFSYPATDSEQRRIARRRAGHVSPATAPQVHSQHQHWSDRRRLHAALASSRAGPSRRRTQMNRRFFLKLIGLAPLVPLAAKLPTLRPPARSGLSLAKLIAARDILNSNDTPKSVRWTRPIPYYLDPDQQFAAAYASRVNRLKYEILLNSILSPEPVKWFKFDSQ